MRFVITKDGYEKLKVELDQLRGIERPNIIKAIAEARAHGDLSENAEYSSAKEKQALIEAKIGDLEFKLVNAEVVDISTMSGTTVRFGATVTIKDVETGQKKTYTIVSEYEMDASNNLISLSAPIARALIGRNQGEYVEVNTPGGLKEYEIISVTWNVP